MSYTFLARALALAQCANLFILCNLVLGQKNAVSNDVKDNGRPSVPVDHQDLKWNIITPAGAVSGPYRIDDLKCVTEVLPFYSQYLMVRKGASRNSAITIHDAIDKENTKIATTDITEGNEENNGQIFDKQLEALMIKENNGQISDKQLEALMKDLRETCILAATPQPATICEEDPKWNILLSGGVEKGPYSLRSLKGVHDISSTSSQYIKVWNEGESKETAITLSDALKLLSQK
ncbi:uncharacterized protein LOC141706960 [Apium graveolens]|uniref:uncharacterized protein LOC141706960 n=1 Tax=Apium graveolens TaxID=4045 RepID=UPI003D7ABCC5